MTFGELFHLAGTNTTFSVFLGDKTSECIDLLDGDFGAGTREAEILDGLMSKNVIRYIPGRAACKRLGSPQKMPHLTVVLEAADCFKCAHRRGRSAIAPNLVWCELRRARDYHKISGEGCEMFREATKSELERNACFDERDAPMERHYDRGQYLQQRALRTARGYCTVEPSKDSLS